MSRALLTVLCVGASISITFAQAIAPLPKPAQKQAAKAALTNDDVAKLVRAGFGDAVVVARIKQASQTAFDTSTDGLIALKAAGVSDRLVTIMLGGPDSGDAPVPAPASTGGPGVGSAALAKASMGRAVPSLSDLEAGIHLTGEEGYTLLEPTVFTGGKTGGVFTSAVTMGIRKAKWKAVVRSPSALQRIRTAKPEFYFVFERKNAGLSNTGGAFTFTAAMAGASSPNEFVLARMTRKESERELIVGEFGTWGASTGTRSEDTAEMTIDRIQPGLYRVSPKEPLADGEYCFFYAAGAAAFASAGTGRLFDFGIDGGRPVQ